MQGLARILASRRLSSVKPATRATGPEADMADEGEIAGLADKPTQELRPAWLKVYRRKPPVGLSRDLMIRALGQ